jgi:hypothetical protein
MVTTALIILSTANFLFLIWLVLYLRNNFNPHLYRLDNTDDAKPDNSFDHVDYLASSSKSASPEALNEAHLPSLTRKYSSE